jgi:hypothetical protein
MRSMDGIKYWNLPKAIQRLVDGAEFLEKVSSQHKDGRKLYVLCYRDSFEEWFQVFDGRGALVHETPFLPRGDAE